MDIVRSFDSNAAKFAGKEFLRFDGSSISYADVQQASRRAAAFFAGLGVRAGDRIALMTYNTPGFVYAMLGAWRIGAVVVPVNHKMQAPEADYLLQHSGARWLVLDAALAPVAAGLATRPCLLSTEGVFDGALGFDAAVQDGCAVSDAAIDLDERSPAEILYTSGTTGRPKGCVHSHRNLVLTAVNLSLAMSVTQEDRTLITVPVWHSSPLNNWLLGTMYVGGTVVLEREYDPARFLPVLDRERVTLCFGPPVIYTAPLAAADDPGGYDLSSVRALVYGGGPIGAETARRLAGGYQTDRFYQVYGMTEAGPLGTALFPGEQVAKAGSIGKAAMTGVDLRLARDDGNEPAAGDVGEIWMRSESMMLGYLDDPHATAQAFTSDGWYRTGDLAVQDADGYLFIVDRITDMIITGGENVYSKEVEDAITAHPGIAEAAVIGRPHPEWGETVIAYVVRTPGEASPDSAEGSRRLREFLAGRIAAYKIPREFRFVASLPRTPTGKPQKHLLRREISRSEAASTVSSGNS
jgi:feruloyl-CoA synthase